MRADLEMNNNSRSGLFHLVYRAVFVRRVVFLLLLSLLLQPLHRSYANEEPVVPPAEPEVLEVQPVSIDIPEPPSVAEDEEIEPVTLPDEPALEMVNTEASPDNSTAPADDASSTTDQVNDSQSIEEDDIPVVEDSEVIEILLPVSSGGEANGTTSVASTTNEVNDLLGVGSNVSDIDVKEDVVDDYDFVEDAAATTSVDDEPILPLIHETFSGSEVRFNKSDCVQVDDGSFYCQPGVSGQAVRDSIVSMPDSDGDLEIFLVKDESYIQLTNNLLDDSAPFYDSVSKNVIWHQLVDSRYRIVTLDLDTGEESYITNGAFNDMEPARYGDVVVWQRWVDDVWQIMLWQDGQEVQLSEGLSHHLSPSVYDNLIMWRTVIDSGSKVLESYDLNTHKHTVIDDPEDAAMVNPRMVMVYDAVYENGDRIARGVDITTGKIITLGVLPAELPETIPDADATGEVRALIQVKPTENDEVDQDEPGPLPVMDPPVPSDPLTLVLSSTTTLQSNEELPPAVEDIPALIASSTDQVDLTQFDLVIPTPTSTQSAGD